MSCSRQLSALSVSKAHEQHAEENYHAGEHHRQGGAITDVGVAEHRAHQQRGGNFSGVKRTTVSQDKEEVEALETAGNTQQYSHFKSIANGGNFHTPEDSPFTSAIKARRLGEFGRDLRQGA